MLKLTVSLVILLYYVFPAAVFLFQVNTCFAICYMLRCKTFGVSDGLHNLTQPEVCSLLFRFYWQQWYLYNTGLNIWYLGGKSEKNAFSAALV